MCYSIPACFKPCHIGLLNLNISVFGVVTMQPSFPPLPQFSVPHSFRLGVPSYVYPADILPNVKALAPYVDDVELVLFESRKPEVGGQWTEVSGQKSEYRRRPDHRLVRRSYLSEGGSPLGEGGTT